MKLHQTALRSSNCRAKLCSRSPGKLLNYVQEHDCLPEILLSPDASSQQMVSMAVTIVKLSRAASCHDLHRSPFCWISLSYLQAEICFKLCGSLRWVAVPVGASVPWQVSR